MSHQLSPLAPIPGTGDRQALRAANREGAHESDEGNVICVTQQVYQLFLSCNSPIVHSILFMFGSCLYWFCVGQEGGTSVLTLVIFHNTTVCGVKKKTWPERNIICMNELLITLLCSTLDRQRERRSKNREHNAKVKMLTTKDPIGSLLKRAWAKSCV